MNRPENIPEAAWNRIVKRRTISPVVDHLLKALEYEREFHAAVVATWEVSHRQASAEAGKERLAKEAALAELRVLTERIKEKLQQALQEDPPTSLGSGLPIVPFVDLDHVVEVTGSTEQLAELVREMEGADEPDEA